MPTDALIETLLASPEPAVRYRVRSAVLGERVAAPSMRGLAREVRDSPLARGLIRCAGQEGYAIWYSLLLGLADERTEILLDRLRTWQWPDGGWNCDKRPQARHSSFHESLIPLRALALHARLTGDARSSTAARRAAEVFLSRRLFKAGRTGAVISPDFLLLQFPHFYPYNIPFGLKVMAEAGFIGDPRCAEALDLLESKRLRDGGFPLERKTWKRSEAVITRGTAADWGSAGRTRSNPFVSADALHILRAAGRLRCV